MCPFSLQIKEHTSAGGTKDVDFVTSSDSVHVSWAGKFISTSAPIKSFNVYIGTRPEGARHIFIVFVYLYPTYSSTLSENGSQCFWLFFHPLKVCLRTDFNVKISSAVIRNGSFEFLAMKAMCSGLHIIFRLFLLFFSLWHFRVWASVEGRGQISRDWVVTAGGNSLLQLSDGRGR